MRLPITWPIPSGLHHTGGANAGEKGDLSNAKQRKRFDDSRRHARRSQQI